jgi:RNA polymerase sigma factor (sigma-70 family)
MALGAPTPKPQFTGLHLWGIPGMLGSKPDLFQLLHQDLSGELGGYIDKHMAKRTLDANGPDDVEQIVWLKVWNSLDTVELRPGHGAHSGLRAWVFTIAHNTLLDLRKKTRHRRHLSLEPDGMVRIDSETVIEPPFEATSASDPHEQTVLAETASLLQAELQKLPEYQAVAIVRGYFGYDSKEQGRVIGKSPGSIRQAWARGRRQLREALEREQQCN